MKRIINYSKLLFILKKSDYAVSSMVGAKKLITIAVIFSSILSVYAIHLTYTKNNIQIPFSQIITYTDENNIYLEHLGGESLSYEDDVLFTIDEEKISKKIIDLIENQNDNKLWNIGEKLCYSFDRSLEYSKVMVCIIDNHTNQIIFKSTIQEDDLGIYVKTNQPSYIGATFAIFQLTYNFQNHPGPTREVRFNYWNNLGIKNSTIWFNTNGGGGIYKKIVFLSQNTTYIVNAEIRYNKLNDQDTYIYENGVNITITTKTINSKIFYLKPSISNSYLDYLIDFLSEKKFYSSINTDIYI